MVNREKAIQQALRQWKMHIEGIEQEDIEDIRHSEADLYRHCKEVIEQSPTVPISAVQEIIHEWFKIGELTVFQYSNIVKEIKQKAGL